MMAVGRFINIEADVHFKCGIDNKNPYRITDNPHKFRIYYSIKHIKLSTPIAHMMLLHLSLVLLGVFVKILEVNAHIDVLKYKLCIIFLISSTITISSVFLVEK